MIVIDRSEYEELHQQATKIVFNGRTYPDFVFRERYSRYYFCEYEVAMEWDVVRALGADEEIFHVILSPSAQDFWVPHCSHFGIVRALNNRSSSAWERDLTWSGPRRMAMHSSAGTSVTFGNGRNWAIFNDYPHDLSVIGTNDSLDFVRIQLRQFIHDVSWAEEYWRAIEARMDDAFYASLRRNYSA